MPDAQQHPQKLGASPYIFDRLVYRYYRNVWMNAGVDNYTQPPAQNPDMFELLTNILPPAENVLLRRFGSRPFIPKLDTGAGDEH